jgi:hypothetical protein
VGVGVGDGVWVGVGDGASVDVGDGGTGEGDGVTVGVAAGVGVSCVGAGGVAEALGWVGSTCCDAPKPRSMAVGEAVGADTLSVAWSTSDPGLQPVTVKMIKRAHAASHFV